MSTRWYDEWRSRLRVGLGRVLGRPTAGDLMLELLEHEPAERAALLDRACDGDAELRHQVASLLAAHEASGPLDRPIARFTPPVAYAPPAVGRTIARYELRELVASGGMGIVYRAWDSALDRAIALKFLPAHLGADERARDRFRIEAQAVAALDHPNICAIHEIGETEDGQLFIAMPYYEGETLRDRLGRGPLAVGDAVTVVRQAADGLAAAHARGITHRDVKPANLLVTVDGVLKILDFGIAKLSHVTLTGQGAPVGTIAYMSPEQAGGEAIDDRTDVWSLGVVLFEALAGAHPFEGGTAGRILRQILDGEPRWQLLADAGVPPALERVLRTALARVATDRYATMTDFARHLEAAVPGAVASTRSRRDAEQDDARWSGDLLPDAERRQAAVVVCQVADHPSLVERWGAASAGRMVRAMHDEADAVAKRHGGIVHHASADGAMLVFGLPVASEDDGLRATRAALELRDAARRLGAASEERGGPALRLRVGIDAGPLIQHPSTGSDAPPEISGDVTRVATHLASMAGPDEVWISAECHRLVEGFVLTEPQPAAPIGARGPAIVPHRVTGESGLETRIEASARVRGLTPFTGRSHELAVIVRQLDQARAGSGQLVVIVGDAGMGKSRLLHEFRQRLDERDGVTLQGRCPSHGGGAAYTPLVHALRDALHLADLDTSQDREGATVAGIRALGPELEEFIPFYLHLLSIPTERFLLPPHLRGEQLQMSMQEAIAALITVCARRRPTVLLLEDWHWADNASRAVLGQIVDLLPEHALLVVVTTRPGRDEDWGGGPGNRTTLALGPLTPTASRALLRALLRVARVPDGLGELLHERTGGNPFFLEELCQTLLEEGILRVDGDAAVLAGPLDALHVPDTVQAVIRARLDRLHRDARDVLRLASVVGRDFARRILEHTMPEEGRLPNALEALKAAGLIQQTHIVPDAAYRFKHVLTQEVAYDGLLEHRRRELHGRVGTAIESLYANRLEEQLGNLAHHFSRAERWEKAVHYGVRAADRASALAQFAEALGTLERARTWLARLADETERRDIHADILLRQERLCETLGLRERQQRIIDELVALLEQVGDQAKLAEVYVRQGDLFTLLRQFDAADTALERSLALRRSLDDRIGVRNTVRSLGLLRWHQGRDVEALQRVEEALAIDRGLGDDVATVGDLSNLGHVLKGLREYERARGYLNEGLELSDRIIARTTDAAERAEVELKQCYLLHVLGNLSREVGDTELGLDYLERARRTAGKRMPIQLSYHYTSLAHVHLQMGRVDDAVEFYRAAVELTRQARFVPGLVQALRMLGEILLGLGRRAEALAALQEAITLFAQLKDRGGEAAMWGRVAAAHEGDGRDAEAMASWAKARALRHLAGDAVGELEALEGLARATRRHLAEPALAAGYLGDALALALSLGDARAEGRLRNALGILEWSRAAYGEALAQYERALAVFRAVGDEAGVGLMLNSLGATLMKLHRLQEARVPLHEALAVHRRGGWRLMEGHTLALLGEIAIEADEPGEALTRLDASLAIRRVLGDRRGEGWMLLLLARAHIAGDCTDRARDAIAMAERAAADRDDDELRTACRQLRASPGL